MLMATTSFLPTKSSLQPSPIMSTTTWSRRRVCLARPCSPVKFASSHNNKSWPHTAFNFNKVNPLIETAHLSISVRRNTCVAAFAKGTSFPQRAQFRTASHQFQIARWEWRAMNSSCAQKLSSGFHTSPRMHVHASNSVIINYGDADQRYEKNSKNQTEHAQHSRDSTLKDVDLPQTRNDEDEHNHTPDKTKPKAISTGKIKKQKELFRADKVLSTRTDYTRSQSSALLYANRVSIQLSDGEEQNNDIKRNSKHKKNKDRNRLSSSSSSSSSFSSSSPSLNLIPLKGPKDKIPMDAILYFDGELIPSLPPLLLVFHKPKFVLSAMDEKHTTKDHLGKYLSDRYKKVGMHPVGRLDYDTSGLLLFSREGELTQRLLHPKHEIEKEYVATVSGGKVDVTRLRQRLEETGVETSEGIHFGRVIDCHELTLEESKDIIAAHKDTGAEQKSDDENSVLTSVGNVDIPLTNVRLVVQEGKYRMVRRMLFNVGHPVIELKRERHGNILLGDLQAGHFRDVSAEEAKWADSIL